MNRSNPRTARSMALGAALLLLAGIAPAADLMLSGVNEVPPVTTSASGSGTMVVDASGVVTGSIKTVGVAGTAAHIHVGSKGKNGPVIVTLTKGADGAWMVPPGAKLSSEQLQSYKAGDLYVNVHSEAHKGGEIRGQMTP